MGFLVFASVFYFGVVVGMLNEQFQPIITYEPPHCRAVKNEIIHDAEQWEWVHIFIGA